MKIKRSKLRKIIREFVDSYRPKDTSTEDMSSTSAYDQLTNSERAAFVSAMGIAETAAGQVNESNLSEGTVTQFPSDRVRPSVENEDEDPVGQVYKFQPYGTDLEGDDTESDPTDLSQQEVDVLSSMMSNVPEDDISRSQDDDFESYLQGLESGKLVDLFDEEY
jgi:hypothetical protein